MRPTKLERYNSRLDRLFLATLQGPYDASQPWSAVRTLRHSRSCLVYDKAVRWCAAKDPLKRARAADVLCQLRTAPHAPGTTQPRFLIPEKSCALLMRMLREDTVQMVLRSALFGLGHLGLAHAVPSIAPFANAASAELRYATTHALLPFHSDAQAFRHLLDLCDDVDHDVRNWALFAIGSASDKDTPEVRTTLACHLSDAFPDAREEAVAGLAKRDDTRALAPLKHLLEVGSYSAHHTWDFAVLAGLSSTTETITPELLLTALHSRFGTDSSNQRLY